MSSKLATVPSFSGDSRHQVEMANGEMICDCIRFGFRKKGTGCTHTEIVHRAQLFAMKCAHKHGLSAGAGICFQCLVNLLAATKYKVRREYILKSEAKEKIKAARKRRTKKGKP